MDNLNKLDLVIIIPTHSSYIDIVKNFLELFKKNWENCNYLIIISVCGENINMDGFKILYNGKNASLIDCIVNVKNKYPSNYYMCFLGDAFINKKIIQKDVDKLLKTMYDGNIQYCSLLCVKNYKKVKSYNDKLRYINSKDRYSHNFVAFIASHCYIDTIMAKCKSDLEYELLYLNNQKNFYYDFDLIFKKNYFGLMPGITKGKWNRFVLNTLKKNNREINFAYRPTESFFESLYSIIREKIIGYIPLSIRKIIKKTRFIKHRIITKE